MPKSTPASRAVPPGRSAKLEQSLAIGASLQGSPAASFSTPSGDRQNIGSNVMPGRKSMTEPAPARSNDSSSLPPRAPAKASAAGSAAQAGLHLGKPSLLTGSIGRASEPSSSGWQGRKPPTYTRRAGASPAALPRRDVPGNDPWRGPPKSSSNAQFTHKRAGRNASKPPGRIDLPPPPRPVLRQPTLLSRLTLVAYRTFRNLRQRR